MNPGDPLLDSWRWTTLGECCTQERTAITSDRPEYAEMPYLGLEHIEGNTGRILVSEKSARGSESTSNNFRFTPEHVLYGKLRPYLNKVALPDFSGRCSTEIIPLRPVDADRGYLAWFLRRSDTVEYAMRGKTGSRMPRASMKELLLLPIPLPPLSEQRRIVAALETRLAAAERARRAALSQLNALEAMPAALLRKVFERDATIKSWRRVEISKICHVFTGGPAPQGEQYFGASGPLFFRVRDLSVDSRTTSLSIARDQLSPIALDTLKLVPINPNTLIFPKSGAAIATNNRALTAVPGYLVSHLMALEAGESVLPLWLYHAFCTLDMTDFSDNTGYPSLRKTTVEDITIPLPPIDEQRAIVAGLEREMAATERARTAARERLALAEALPGAILRRAFTPGASA